MKRIIILFAIVLLFTSCPQPVQTIDPAPTGTIVSVLNSYWEVVKQDTLSRAIDSTEAYVAEVKEHNAQNISNQWFIYVGEYPAIEDSPPCTIYMCDKVTNLPISYPDGNGGTITLKWENWPRVKLVENRDNWQREADRWNANLYIDVIPPAPIATIPTEEDLFVKYTINVLTNSGKVQYCEHCTNTFRQADWPNDTLETFFQKRVQAWNMEIFLNPGADMPWRVETGKIYEVIE